MATKRTKTTLPDNFDQYLERGNLSELIAIFEDTEIDARGGHGKTTALAYRNCPDELTRWLVAHGADINAEDTWGRTPLENRMMMRANIDVLLELGCRVKGRPDGRSIPLHTAASMRAPHYVNALLDRGADIHATDRSGLTALEYALQRCSNPEIPTTAVIAKVLLERGAQKTDKAKALVRQLGETFEFHRAGFNKDLVHACSAGLDELYALFDVPPVARRQEHDGKSLIGVKASTSRAQFDELWKLLVPSSGPAATVQGEVVRIAGRIADEILRNGGGNWDAEYGKMAKALSEHLRSGDALSSQLMADIDEVLKTLPREDRGLARLTELAVAWVLKNPKPVPLSPPPYRR